jgi:hypothetical protein
MGTLKSPLSFGMEKQLTANPMQQASQMLKGSQTAAPKVPKMPGSLPKQRRKANPFFGE